MLKVNGVENVKEITYGPLCFPRGDDFLAFIAQPVWSMDEFDKLVPFPKNTNVFFNSEGKKVEDYECSAWKDTEAEYWRVRWGYIVLKTLEPSNMEIDGVTLDDPKTWGSVESILAGELNPQEFNRLMAMVDEANALDARKLEANKATFIERQTAKNSLQGNSSGSASAKDSE
jgi:hypothetical protein